MSAYAQVGENLDDLAALIEEKPFRAFFCFANENIIRWLQVFSCIFLVQIWIWSFESTQNQFLVAGPCVLSLDNCDNLSNLAVVVDEWGLGAYHSLLDFYPPMY